MCRLAPVATWFSGGCSALMNWSNGEICAFIYLLFLHLSTSNFHTLWMHQRATRGWHLSQGYSSRQTGIKPPTFLSVDDLLYHIAYMSGWHLCQHLYLCVMCVDRSASSWPKHCLAVELVKCWLVESLARTGQTVAAVDNLQSSSSF